MAAWLRADSPMVVKVSLRQAAAPYVEYASRTVRVVDQWAEVAVTGFTHGLTSSENLDALVMISSATPGILWVDDASLVYQSHKLVLPEKTIHGEYFGTHIMHPVNLRGAVRSSFFGSMRVWDSTDSQWFRVQPRRPKEGRKFYNWRVLDQRYQEADRAGMDVLMVLGGYAPAWASMDDEYLPSSDSDCYRCEYTPNRLSDWASWVEDLVSRFKGGERRHWEVWNEPNFPEDHAWCPSVDLCRGGLGSMYKGTPEQLLDLQRTAFRIIKRIDPSAKVVSPGVSYHHRNYLDYFLKIGGGQYSDVIGFHIYQDGPPELLMPHVLAIRSLMADHGVGHKPLWSTESAIEKISYNLDEAVMYHAKYGGRKPSPADLASAYLARFYVIGWGSGLARIYHYAWDDQHGWPSSPTVINRNNNAVVRVNSSGVALEQVSKWMVGRTLVRFETGQNGGLWRAVFKDAGGVESQVIWHPGRPVDHAVPVELPAQYTRQCDLAGVCQKIEAGRAKVDFRPTWFGSR